MREAIGTMLRRLRPTMAVIEIGRLGLLSTAILQHGEPSLFSLDLKLPDTTGVSGIRLLKNQYPVVPVAVLSASPAHDWEAHCIDAGADVYIDKAAGAVEIGAMLKGLLSADNSFEEPLVGQKISKRQMELLHLLDKGMSNKDITVELGIQEHTVKVHLWRLFRRIEVKSRTQAVYYARQHGILTT